MHRATPTLVTAVAITALITVAATSPVAAQLAPAWVVTAAANNAGEQGTYWRTDLTVHNPHEYALPVVVQLLPSNTVNWQAPAVDLDLGPWETVNLWDALGPEVFAVSGTAALLLYAGDDADCSQPGSCEFLATSRTYTPEGVDGEFGQTIPGLAASQGTDWWTYGYAAGILNDGWYFRCNVGAMSWTASWVQLNVDVQDAAGNVIATEVLEIPPFGHVQRRLQAEVTGGSLVYYLVDGPDDALVFPYASVVNEVTGDPSYVAAIASDIGPVLPNTDRLRDLPRDRPAVSRWIVPSETTPSR